MGFWGYVSPFFAGLGFTLIQYPAVLSWLDALTPLPEALRWLALIGLALLAGVAAQLLMIGAQGAFAQVLPVPFGRSLRGRAAVISGTALLIGVSCAAGAVLLHSREFPMLFNILGIAGLAGLTVALVAYFWGMPSVVRDFDLRRTEME